MRLSVSAALVLFVLSLCLSAVAASTIDYVDTDTLVAWPGPAAPQQRPWGA